MHSTSRLIVSFGNGLGSLDNCKNEAFCTILGYFLYNGFCYRKQTNPSPNCSTSNALKHCVVLPTILFGFSGSSQDLDSYILIH